MMKKTHRIICMVVIWLGVVIYAAVWWEGLMLLIRPPLSFYAGGCALIYAGMHVYAIRVKGHCCLSAEPLVFLVTLPCAWVILGVHGTLGLLPWPLFSVKALYALGALAAVLIVGHGIVLIVSFVGESTLEWVFRKKIQEEALEESGSVLKGEL